MNILLHLVRVTLVYFLNWPGMQLDRPAAPQTVLSHLRGVHAANSAPSPQAEIVPPDGAAAASPAQSTKAESIQTST